MADSMDVDDAGLKVAAGMKRRREEDAADGSATEATPKARAAAAKTEGKARGMSAKESPAPARSTPQRQAKRSAKKAVEEDEEEDGVTDEDEDDDEEEEEEDDDDAEIKPRAKGKAKPKAKAAPKRKEKAATPTPRKRAKKAVEGDDGEEVKSAPTKKVKDMKPVEMVEAAMKAHKWWEETALAGGVKWRYMEHRGVCFPPPYKPHGVRMKYEGAEVDLTPPQEELATFFAGISPDAPQLSTPKTAKVFTANFFDAFKKVLGPGHVIKRFEGCDFGPIRALLERRREAKKALSKAEKEVEKGEKAATQLTYGFAMVDSHLEKMGNYNIEPPGLFRGRGLHPKMGTLKRRVQPEDITLNLAHDAVVPACPVPGHAWKRVVHDPTVAWLANWKESVMTASKYVMLAASSSFKGISDREKYEKARRLKKYIDKIRGHYEKLLQSEDDFERQSGTAMWVIDRLALRVGGEKDEDEADTVGCCSLRVEHISFPSDHEITLDFLGKDSMRYNQTINFDNYGPVGKLVYKNLRRFAKDKKRDQDLFDRLMPSRLNDQFSALMPGLSAKVFRTYNASVTLERELEDMDPSTPAAEKVLEYNRANREVAILCNHQRSVPKAFEKTWEKLTLKEALLLKQLEELRDMQRKVAKGEKVRIKSAEVGDAEDDDEDEADAKGKAAGVPAAAAAKDTEKEEAAARAKRAAEEQAHLWTRQPSKEDVARRVTQWEEKLEKLRVEMRNKDENKAVSLSTAKINYMDPRISVRWCKAVELPIERIFPRTLRDKFPWAMGAPTDFRF